MINYEVTSGDETLCNDVKNNDVVCSVVQPITF